MARTSLGELAVEVVADIGALRSGLNQGIQVINSFSQQATRGVQTFGTGFQRTAQQVSTGAQFMGSNYDRFAVKIKEVTNKTREQTDATDETKKGIDKQGESLRKIRPKMDEFKGGITGIVGGMSKWIQFNLTWFATWRLMWAVLGAIKAGVKAVVDFDTAITNLGAVTAATQEQLLDLETAARAVGAATKFTAVEVAEAMVDLSKAGFSVSEVNQMISGTTLLAIGTLSDLTLTTQLVATTLRTFQLEAGEAAQVANIFAAAITNSRLTMEGLKNSLKYIGPIMSAIGYDLADTAAVLGVLADRGLEAGISARGLRGFFSALIAPTRKLRIELEKVGISVSQVNPLTNDLADILLLLSESGFDVESSMRGLERRVGTTAVALVSAAEYFVVLRDAISETVAAEVIAGRQTESLSYQLVLLRSKATEVALDLSGILLPSLKDIVSGISELLTGIDQVTTRMASLMELIPDWIQALPIAGVAFPGLLKGLEDLADREEDARTEIARTLVTLQKQRTELARTGVSLGLYRDDSERMRMVLTGLVDAYPEILWLLSQEILTYDKAKKVIDDLMGTRDAQIKTTKVDLVEATKAAIEEVKGEIAELEELRKGLEAADFATYSLTRAALWLKHETVDGAEKLARLKMDLKGYEDSLAGLIPKVEETRAETKEYTEAILTAAQTYDLAVAAGHHYLELLDKMILEELDAQQVMETNLRSMEEGTDERIKLEDTLYKQKLKTTALIKEKTDLEKTEREEAEKLADAIAKRANTEVFYLEMTMNSQKRLIAGWNWYEKEIGKLSQEEISLRIGYMTVLEKTTGEYIDAMIEDNIRLGIGHEDTIAQMETTWANFIKYVPEAHAELPGLIIQDSLKIVEAYKKHHESILSDHQKTNKKIIAEAKELAKTDIALGFEVLSKRLEYLHKEAVEYPVLAEEILKAQEALLPDLTKTYENINEQIIEAQADTVDEVVALAGREHQQRIELLEKQLEDLKVFEEAGIDVSKKRAEAEDAIGKLEILRDKAQVEKLVELREAYYDDYKAISEGALEEIEFTSTAAYEREKEREKKRYQEASDDLSKALNENVMSKKHAAILWEFIETTRVKNSEKIELAHLDFLAEVRSDSREQSLQVSAERDILELKSQKEFHKAEIAEVNETARRRMAALQKEWKKQSKESSGNAETWLALEEEYNQKFTLIEEERYAGVARIEEAYSERSRTLAKSLLDWKIKVGIEGTRAAVTSAEEELARLEDIGGEEIGNAEKIQAAWGELTESISQNTDKLIDEISKLPVSEREAARIALTEWYNYLAEKYSGWTNVLEKIEEAQEKFGQDLIDYTKRMLELELEIADKNTGERLQILIDYYKQRIKEAEEADEFEAEAYRQLVLALKKLEDELTTFQKKEADSLFEYQRLTGEKTLKDEIKNIEIALESVKKGSIEETALLTKLFNLKKKLADEEIALLEKQFGYRRELGLESLEDEISRQAELIRTYKKTGKDQIEITDAQLDLYQSLAKSEKELIELAVKRGESNAQINARLMEFWKEFAELLGMTAAEFEEFFAKHWGNVVDDFNLGTRTMSEAWAELMGKMKRESFDWYNFFESLLDSLKNAIATWVRGVLTGWREYYDEKRKLDEEYAKDREKIEEDFSERLKDLQERRLEAIEDYNDDIIELEEDKNEDLEKARIDYEKRIADLEKRRLKEIEDYNERVADLEEKRVKDLEKARKTYEKRIADLEKRKLKEIEKYNKKIVDLEKKKDKNLTKLREKYEKDLAKAQKDLIEEEEDYREDIEELEKKHKERLKKLNEKYVEDALDALDEMYDWRKIRLLKDSELQEKVVKLIEALENEYLGNLDEEEVRLHDDRLKRLYEIRDETFAAIQEEEDAFIESMARREKEHEETTQNILDAINELTREYTKNVSEIQIEFTETMQEIEEAHNETLKDIFDNINELTKEYNENVKEIQDNFIDAMQELEKSHRETMKDITETIAELTKDYLDRIKEIEENFEERMEDIEKKHAETITDLEDQIRELREKYEEDLLAIKKEWEKRLKEIEEEHKPLMTIWDTIKQKVLEAIAAIIATEFINWLMRILGLHKEVGDAAKKTGETSKKAIDIAVAATISWEAALIGVAVALVSVLTQTKKTVYYSTENMLAAMDKVVTTFGGKTVASIARVAVELAIEFDKMGMYFEKTIEKARQKLEDFQQQRINLESSTRERLITELDKYYDYRELRTMSLDELLALSAGTRIAIEEGTIEKVEESEEEQTRRRKDREKDRLKGIEDQYKREDELLRRKIALTKIEIKFLEFKIENERRGSTARADQLAAELEQMLENYKKSVEAYEDAEEKKQEATKQTTKVVESASKDTSNAVEKSAREGVTATEKAAQDMIESYKELARQSIAQLVQMKKEGKLSSRDIERHMVEMTNKIRSKLGELPKSIGIPVNTWVRGIEGVLTRFRDIPRDIYTRVHTTPEFAQGGLVQSLQRGGEVLAALHPGEWVIPKGTVDAIRATRVAPDTLVRRIAGGASPAGPAGSRTLQVRVNSYFYGEIRAAADMEEFSKQQAQAIEDRLAGVAQ